MTQELKPVAKKIEAKINSKGTPLVKIRVKNSTIFVDAPYYAIFQDKGVAGNKSGRSLAGFKYKDKMPPPFVFERYTDDPRIQYAIAKSIQKKGFPAKKYIDSTLGHYSPQIARALDKGIEKYTDKEVFKI